MRAGKLGAGDDSVRSIWAFGLAGGVCAARTQENVGSAFAPGPTVKMREMSAEKSG